MRRRHSDQRQVPVQGSIAELRAPETIACGEQGAGMPEDASTRAAKQVDAHPSPDPPRPSVGYRSPPFETRFRKGKSGNPKGRPRKQLSATQAALRHPSDIIRAELDHLVTVRDAGGERQVPVFQAILLAERQAAAKGNVIAQRNHLARLEKAEQEQKAEVAREHEIAKGYIDYWREEERNARRFNLPLPCPFPHPDDIVLEPGKPVRFKGPRSEEEVGAIEHLCATRDVLLMQGIWETRKGFHSQAPHSKALHLAATPAASHFAWNLNTRLLEVPLVRYHLSEAEMAAREDRFNAIPLRQLEAELLAAWANLGVQLPYPVSVGSAEQMIERVERRTRR